MIAPRFGGVGYRLPSCGEVFSQKVPLQKSPNGRSLVLSNWPSEQAARISRSDRLRLGY
jgi:hypothetical protein